MEHYVPSFLLVILSWVSFWLSIDATPARASLGITTVLTLTTLSSSARTQLPKVSYTKAIDIWMLVCSFFVFAALLEFAVASYLDILEKSRVARIKAQIREQAEPEGAQDIIGLRLATTNGSGELTAFCQSCRKNKQRRRSRFHGNGTNNGECSGAQKVTYENKRNSTNIDKFSRVLFPLAFSLFNAVYWPSYLYEL
ncbi:glycine receptor subunit alpha-2-like [Saccoglossus kowalevskii]